MIAEILEAAMLVAFGLSWPLNAYKNYRARTAAGTSWQFIALITLGYFAGIGAKFASGTLNWVLVVYFLNLAFLAVNWGVYFRNRRLDHERMETSTITAASPYKPLGKVLIASDGSKAALSATRFAAEALGLRNGARVSVLTVAPDGSKHASESAVAALERTDKVLEEANAESVHMIRTGAPATEIVKAANKMEADVLVMGSRGLSGLREIMLGSVTRDVVNRVTCPVLVVK